MAENNLLIQLKAGIRCVIDSQLFDGEFRDSSWTDLPSPDEVKASVTRAITKSSSNVFEVKVERVEVTAFKDPLPEFIPAGYISASVVVRWDVNDDD